MWRMLQVLLVLRRLCVPGPSLVQALARLRFSTEVAQSDVDEALRLMQMSKSSLLQDASRRNASLDPISHIYSIIRDEALRSRAGSTVS